MSKNARGPIVAKLVTAAVLLWAMTGCASPAPPQPDLQETSYCTVPDADGNGFTVVDDDMCDDDGDGHGGGGVFVLMDGHSSHSRGTHLAKSQIKGSPIPYNNQAARSSAGLPSTGKVSTGQRTTVRSGIGNGSTGNSGSSSGG